MIKLKINPNFRKFIHLELTKSTSRMKFTHTIVGSTLLINPMDLESAHKAMKRLELRLK